MARTNLGDVQLDDFNSPAGRGALGAQVAAIKADLVALRATVASLVTFANALKVDVTAVRTAAVDLRTLANEVKGDYNATLAKLDLDAGVTDVNYAATNGTAAADVGAVAALTVGADVGAPAALTMV